MSLIRRGSMLDLALGGWSIKVMRKASTLLLGALACSIGLWSATLPASALGGCGPNRHRNAWGYCVWGGQNQAWCLRHTGHVAAYGPRGTRWCGR